MNKVKYMKLTEQLLYKPINSNYARLINKVFIPTNFGFNNSDGKFRRIYFNRLSTNFCIVKNNNYCPVELKHMPKDYQILFRECNLSRFPPFRR